MNITFLIGNGFDLNLGFKTSYQDFYDYYFKLKGDPLLANFKNIILKQRYSTWSDAESGLGKITQEFKNKNSIEEFNKFYDDIVESLYNYLNNEQGKFKFIAEKSEIAQTTYKILSSILSTAFIHEGQFESLKNIRDIQKLDYSFINFNYTKIFDEFISTLILEAKSIPNALRKDVSVFINPPIHIHGTLDNSIVFGVDNKEQISNDLFKTKASVTDFIIKRNAIDASDITRNSIATNILNRSELICIYGISLGETDSSWWKLIKEWLNYSKYNQLIVFTHNKQYIPASTRSLLNIKNTVFNKLFGTDYLDSPLRNQVHFSVNSPYFNDFKQLISNVTEPANSI